MATNKEMILTSIIVENPIISLDTDIARLIARMIYEDSYSDPLINFKNTKAPNTLEKSRI